MSLQYHLPLPYRETMTAEDFMVTASNREAALWLLKLEPTSWPRHCMILYGPKGCGKTHLLNAWGEKYRARFLSLNDSIVGDLVAGPCPAPALAFDDADRIAVNPDYEEWMQHLFNATKAAEIPLLLTARNPPGVWGLGLKDIDSRLKSCPAIAIKEPDDDLVRGMLVKHFSDRQLMVSADVIDFLVSRLERTGSAISFAIETLDKAALEQKRKITVPFVQHALCLSGETDLLIE